MIALPSSSSLAFARPAVSAACVASPPRDDDGPRPLDDLLERALRAQVGSFIAQHALSPTFAALAADVAARDAIWEAMPDPPSSDRHRPPACDLRVWLCFLLACHALGLDAVHGARLARAARQPERWMRLFLSDHGLIDYGAFEPVPMRAVGSPGVRTPWLSRRRTRGATAPRPAAAPG